MQDPSIKSVWSNHYTVHREKITYTVICKPVSYYSVAKQWKIKLLLVACYIYHQGIIVTILTLYSLV